MALIFSFARTIHLKSCFKRKNKCCFKVQLAIYKNITIDSCDSGLRITAQRAPHFLPTRAERSLYLRTLFLPRLQRRTLPAHSLPAAAHGFLGNFIPQTSSAHGSSHTPLFAARPQQDGGCPGCRSCQPRRLPVRALSPGCAAPAGHPTHDGDPEAERTAGCPPAPLPQHGSAQSPRPQPPAAVTPLPTSTRYRPTVADRPNGRRARGLPAAARLPPPAPQRPLQPPSGAALRAPPLPPGRSAPAPGLRRARPAASPLRGASARLCAPPRLLDPFRQTPPPRVAPAPARLTPRPPPACQPDIWRQVVLGGGRRRAGALPPLRFVPPPLLKKGASNGRSPPAAGPCRGRQRGSRRRGAAAGFARVGRSALRGTAGGGSTET